VSEVAILLSKELRQLRRNRAALLSSTLLPLFLITAMPIGQLLAMRAAPDSARSDIPDGVLPPGLAGLADDPTILFVRVLLPLFITLGGLIVPTLSATYTVVTEREKRTLDLLMALPVTVRDILLAKLLSMLLVATLVVLPLFVVDAAVLLVLGAADVPYLALLLLILFASLACSVGIALLLALLARDFRTANNLNGALIAPLILLVMAVLFLVPSPASYLVLIVLLIVSGVLAFVAGLRWLTFERYLA
jgi:ABC-2 type transport system permease protein